MSVIYWLVIAVAVFAVHCFVAAEFFDVAKMKGWSQKKYLIMAILLWIVGYLLIVALPDRTGTSMNAVICDDLPEL
ncbi:MAG: hypothetical protein Q4E35_04545 [Eubacteriales bacterium]|nr:hypothetical protein [Eubacteriales bacterium]